MNHPFYKKIIEPLCGQDLIQDEEKKEKQDIKDSILLLLFAYAKAESMFNDNETLFANLRTQWGTALATALNEYDQEAQK